VYPNAPVIYGGRLEITSAAITEAEVAPEVFLEDQTAVRIPLLQSLQPGETITVHLEFSGQTPENFGSSRVYGIFNYDPLNEVLILANWYPILAVRSGGDWEAVEVSSIGDAVNSDTAVFQLTVQAQQGWKLIATGTELKDQTENDGNVMEFISGPVRDFMLVASPAFIPEEIPFEDVTITHWQLPNIEYPDTTTEVAHASMQIFTDRFGVYPYTELDIVDVPLQNAGGVEYPGLILVEQGLYQRPQSADYLKVVVAHEVGHQWWYSVVGNDVYENPWQDEALATFSALLYFQQHDVQYYRGLLSYYRDSVTQFESQYGQTPIAQPVTAFENAPGSAYSDIVYFKGALFFVALRDEIGDEAFFRALNSYYQTGMFSITSPEVLLRAFERSCGCDLSAFYADWGVIGQ
jgi:aminopeptidase N